jgi:hypothetical protein
MTVEGALWKMQQLSWEDLLFRAEAAVSVAVHEGKDGRKLFLSNPLQAPEKTISTAEQFQPGKRTQMDGKVMCLKAKQEAVSWDFLLCLFLVGVRGFEPPTTTTPLWCATGLRYTPLFEHDAL